MDTTNSKKILNFGCGDTTIEGAINADRIKLPNVDIAFNFEQFPYPFEDNSFDEIHMYFVLEHLFDTMSVIKELHRILKKGGQLYIRVPHGSSCYTWEEFTHYRGYGVRSFDIFSDESKRGYYSDVRFKVNKRKLKYFLTYPYDFYKYNSWLPDWEKRWYGPFIKLYVDIIQFLIDINPAVFERFWCYWVGGAAEVYVELEKV